MRNIIRSLLAWVLLTNVAFGQAERIRTKSFSQTFPLKNTSASHVPMFHVFTNYEQMAAFFKPVIINENNAASVIGDKDFVNQFVVAITGTDENDRRPVITKVEANDKTVYVFYETLMAKDNSKSSVVAITRKNDFGEIVFVDRLKNVQRRIYYNDVPPVVSKIVVSYLDMPKSEAYKFEYQISIDETGDLIALKDENGVITSRYSSTIPTALFDRLRGITTSLENSGEKIDRSLTGDKKYNEILLMNDANRVIYALTWDLPDKVNESTRQLVQTIGELVPGKITSFDEKREIARNTDSN